MIILPLVNQYLRVRRVYLVSISGTRHIRISFPFVLNEPQYRQQKTRSILMLEVSTFMNT